MKKGKIKKRGFYIFIIFFFIFVGFNVNAISFGVSYFDKDCYEQLCKNNTLLLNNKTNNCVFEPVVNESKSFSGDVEYDVKNKEEFLKLSENTQARIYDIFLECVKRNQTATVEAQKEFSRSIILGLLKRIFKFILYIIFPIIVTILLVSWIGDKIANRKNRKGRKK